MGVLSFFSNFFSTGKNQKADYLLVGLGNIGEEYSLTRHNIGFLVADALIKKMVIEGNGRIPESDFYYGTFGSDKRIVVAKPRTLMNRSGAAVDKLIKKFEVEISSVLVIVDDFNIPMGRLRVRKDGSHGGHNGLKSIISYIGADFPRLRIGIGPLPENTGVIDFVLGNFTKKEQDVLQDVIEKAVDASQKFTCSSIDTVMNNFNK